MTALYAVIMLVGALGLGFMAGRAWQATRTPQLLARMAPDQLRALAARTAKHRRTTT